MENEILKKENAQNIMEVLKNKINDKQQLDNDKQFSTLCGQMEQYLLQKAPNEICRRTYCFNFLHNCFNLHRSDKTKTIVEALKKDKIRLDMDGLIDGKSNTAMAAILIYYTNNKDIIFNDNYFYLGFYNNINLLYE